MIDIELVIQADVDPVFGHIDFHVLCVDADEHLTVRGLVIGLVLLIFLEDHMGTGGAALHDLHRFVSGDPDLVADRACLSFKDLIINDIVFPVFAVIAGRRNDFNAVIARFVSRGRIFHNMNMFS